MICFSALTEKQIFSVARHSSEGLGARAWTETVRVSRGKILPDKGNKKAEGARELRVLATGPEKC